ncbi:LexA family protein [Kutzneria buriramensis]|uniref:LexA family protein n=1 Tax=Kutzneria buriramensis TaxID=1045776 RepID=UPI003748197D
MLVLRSITMEGPPVVPAGFPSPAEDYYDGPIDLDAHLIRNPAATFIMRISGRSMEGVGIHDGDEIIVDRSLRAGDGSIIVAVLDNEFTCKTLRTDPPRLEPANPDFEPIPIPEEGITVWGVVTTVIHHVLPGGAHAG